ncbi:asparaginase, partial [Agrobacterium sp.]|uniref:asparaginase n=1 Tax=Agrobacterium sp. TaxID=361 RepID=UPI003919BE61
EDGTTRAAEAMITALLARYSEKSSQQLQDLLDMSNRSMKNWNRIHVGDVRVAADFAQ